MSALLRRLIFRKTSKLKMTSSRKGVDSVRCAEDGVFIYYWSNLALASTERLKIFPISGMVCYLNGCIDNQLIRIVQKLNLQ